MSRVCGSLCNFRKACFIIIAIITTAITYDVSRRIKERDAYTLHIDPFIVCDRWNTCQADSLPDLSQLQWPSVPTAKRPTGVRLPRGTVYRPTRSFEPIMSRGQRALSEHLLHVFADLMSSNGLGDRFFLNAGTLLGSFRHHDIIPWDEDVDVLVDLQVRSKVQQLMKPLKPDYMYYQGKVRDKIFAKLIHPKRDAEDLELGRKTTRFPWSWPFLDLGFYMVNATHVYELAWYRGRQQSWPRVAVFPLIFRPLGKRWYPAPFHTLQFINATIPFTPSCHMGAYDHILELDSKDAQIPCFELRKRYAFVRRRLSIHRLDYSNIMYKYLIPNLVVTEEQLIVYPSQTATEAAVVHSILLPAQLEEAVLDAYDYTRWPN